MKRGLLLAALLVAGCSRKAALNYRHCLKLRVGMTKAEMIQIMGEPEETIPYVEGQSLSYLKGRTAYEWSNPASMPGGDHVSLDETTGKIGSIRCSNSEITASVYVEPPAPSTAAAPSAAAVAPAKSVSASTATAALGTLADAVAAYRKKDLPKALKIVNPLAGAGDPEAQLLLGLIFFTAKDAGMVSNVPEAMRWFYQSSRLKNCEAAAYYAASIQGRATPETVIKEAVEASQLGCPAAKLLEVKLLFEGYQDALAPDVPAGEKLLLGAAQDGSAQAQLMLGERLQNAAKDLVQSYRWTLAASKHPLVGPFDDPLHALSNAWSAANRTEAENRLKELQKRMTPAQLAEARRR